MAAKKIKIIHPEEDHPLVPKENLLLAFSAQGAFLGSASLHPYSDPDLEPLHPDNITFAFHPAPDQTLEENTRDALLEAVVERAAAIKAETGKGQTRLYSCVLADQQEEIDYLLQRGYQPDEKMLILEKELGAPLERKDIPKGLDLVDNLLSDESGPRKLIAAHQAVFPRHPYSRERLTSLSTSPGWLNLTLVANQDLAGNIMLLIDDQDPRSGWIEDLFISRSYRRRGAASCLLREGIGHFQSLGLDTVRLELWSANLAAKALYDKFKFQVVAETEIALGRMI